MPKPKTPPQRQASYKERMLAKGYVRKTVWIKKKNESKFAKLVEKFNI